MKICVSAESTIDLPIELLTEYDIHTLPFTVLLGETALLDGQFPPTDIISFVQKTKKLPKTSAVNESQFEEYFTKLQKDYDYIIHISLSSEISSACENARKVAKRMKNITIIDSRSLSTGIALLAIYAAKLRDKKYKPQDIISSVEKRIPSLQVSFILERLDYLYKGGRCSSLAYFGANILGIKPEILVTDGKMHSGKKFRGKWNDAVIKYCEDILEKFNTPDKEEVFITYTTADDSVVSNVKKLLESYGFKNIHITHAGATITSHCGEHCLGILYINDGK